MTYERIPAGRRITLHQRIGEREEQGHAARVAEHAAVLAVHFERGQSYGKAVHYHGHAAQNALHRSALHEAIAHATIGVSLLQRLTATPERHQQELRLQTILGAAGIATKGFAAPEVGRAYTRAHELCHQVGGATQLFPVLFGLALFHSTRGQLNEALEVEAHLHHLAQRYPDPVHSVEVYFVSGLFSFFQGDLAASHTAWARSVALHNPEHTPTHLSLYGHHPGIVVGVMSSFVYWLRGYPTQAVSHVKTALMLAKELAHPYCLSLALFWAANLYRSLGDFPTMREQLDVLFPYAHAHGILNGVLFGAMIDGWMLARQGQAEDGITRIR